MIKNAVQNTAFFCSPLNKRTGPDSSFPYVFCFFLGGELSMPQSNIQSVTAQQSANKVAQSISILSQAFGSVILPIAGLSMLISVAMFILGGVFHASTLRKVGAGGMISVSVGVLLYFAIPTIFGLLQAMSQPFK